jgi:hypothetical protein
MRDQKANSRSEPGLRGRIRFLLHATTVAAYLQLCAFALPAAPAQIRVDRIIARIEADILTESDLRDLAKMQMLMDGKAEPEDALFSRLVEQWIIRTELNTAGFPHAAVADVQKAIEELEKRFSSAEAFAKRLAELDLTAEDLKRLLGEQMRTLRYVDYKLRSTAQPSAEDIKHYYDDEFGPRMRERGETPPPLDDVEPQIRELLVEKEIAARTERWLKETRARIKVERIGARSQR